MRLKRGHCGSVEGLAQRSSPKVLTRRDYPQPEGGRANSTAGTVKLTLRFPSRGRHPGNTAALIAKGTSQVTAPREPGVDDRRPRRSRDGQPPDQPDVPSTPSAQLWHRLDRRRQQQDIICLSHIRTTVALSNGAWGNLRL